MIKHSDIPNCYNTDDYLYRVVNGIEEYEDRYSNQLYEIKINTDGLLESAQNAFSRYGWYGFANIFSDKLERVRGYGGLSLTYNPDYAYPLDDVHEHTLGYKRIGLPENFFEDNDIWNEMIERKLDKDFYMHLYRSGIQQAVEYLKQNNIKCKDYSEEFYQQPLKNTYSDTYGFRHLTPAALDIPITHKFRKTIVRSRLASLNTKLTEEEAPGSSRQKLWHRDGTWFKEFRINICLSNPENQFTLQVADTEVVFKPGHAYIWNTYDMHVHHSKTIVDADRINLIYAVSPWFDYNALTDTWTKNKYFMKKHPIEMLFDNEIIDIDVQDCKTITY